MSLQADCSRDVPCSCQRRALDPARAVRASRYATAGATVHQRARPQPHTSPPAPAREHRGAVFRSSGSAQSIQDEPQTSLLLNVDPHVSAARSHPPRALFLQDQPPRGPAVCATALRPVDHAVPGRSRDLLPDDPRGLGQPGSRRRGVARAARRPLLDLERAMCHAARRRACRPLLGPRSYARWRAIADMI